MKKGYWFVAAAVLASGAISVAGRAEGRMMRSSNIPVLEPVRAVPAVRTEVLELKAGESLSAMVARTGIASEDAAKLVDEIARHEDPRRLRPGFRLEADIREATDLLREARIRIDADRTLSIRPAEGRWESTVTEVPVRREMVVLTGTVGSSLYQALIESEHVDLPAEDRARVVDALADRIFAWKVDFSRDLREGDEFSIVYERLARPDGTAREGTIRAARLSLSGKVLEAFHFDEMGRSGYYDAKGESLRGGFLRAPLEYRRISSAFSTGRFHPVLKVRRAHNGVDYAASSGTPVRTVGDGVVVRAGWAGGYGKLVEIRHAGGYTSRYAHLRGFGKGIRAGARVSQAQVIGYVGTTGMSTGPHLHFEFHKNGRPINPSKSSAIAAPGLAGKERAAFRSVVRDNQEWLEQGSGRFDVGMLRNLAEERERG